MLKIIKNLNLMDVAVPFQIGMQDASSSVGEEIVFLNDKILFYQIIILTTVLWFITWIVVSRKRIPLKYATHAVWLEIAWTIAPALILVIISLPSFRLLYIMDEVTEPELTVKAIGHQWYWRYECSDKEGLIDLESYMVPTEDLKEGEYRLLEVDNPLYLPVNTQIRVLITGADVIHSWWVPSLGIKLDGIPGRINGTSLFIKREGIYYGQCAELCGAYHGFMPIVVKGVKVEEYIRWIEGKNIK